MTSQYILLYLMSKPEKLDPKKMIGHVFGEYPFSFTEFQSILFALGSGFSKDPLNQSELKYTYENHQDFNVFLTYNTQMIGVNLLDSLLECPVMPADFNPLYLLHAQHRVQFLKNELKPNTEYMTRLSIHDVIDKQKSYMVILKTETFEKQTKQLIFINFLNFFIRQKGSSGFPGQNPLPKLIKIPTTSPSAVIKIKTVENQALIFRLSGDTNPIHVDPSAAKMGKLPQPILHGLCTLSTSMKAIVTDFLSGNQEIVKNYHVRFLGMVFPGEQFSISVWKHNNGQTLVFETKVVQRNLAVLMGMIDLKEQAKL